MMEKTLVVLLHVNAILFAVPGSRADVKCSSGEQLAEVVLQEGDITMFYTKGRRYKDNMNCTAVYTLGEDCEGAEISCDSFHTRANRRCSKGDYLEISDDVDSERYCRRSGPYYHEPIGDFTLQFISDEKKRGKGMNCYVSCPERGSGSGSGSGSVGEDLIENGDFEKGLLAWETSGCTATVENGTVHVYDRTNKYSQLFQMLNASRLSEMDTALRFSFSVKSNQDTSMAIKLKITKNSQDRYDSFAAWDSKANTWQSLKTTFTVSEFVKGAASAKLFIDADQGVEYWLDDISLQPVDDQTWKTQANKRIDKLRKRDVQIVLEGDGTEDVLIELVQKTHSFPFGTMIVADQLNDCKVNNVDSEYCKFTKDNFNWVVDNYKMKWKYMEKEKDVWNTEIQDEMIQYAQSNNLKLRGHCLLWAKAQNNPSWLHGLSTEEFISQVYERLDFTTKWAEPYALHWDVINEMVDQPAGEHTYYLDKTGDPDFRVKVFKRVKELIPSTTLFLNDYGIITNRNNRFALYQQQIRKLLADGAPIDGIGLQSHLQRSRVDAEYFTYVIEELYKEFGLPIWITEFDWNSKGEVSDPDNSILAQQVEDFYRLMFSLEAVEGIMMWGFIKEFGSIVDQNINPNTAGDAYLRLYHEEWRTKISTTVSNVMNKNVMVRGFRGDYELKITTGRTLKERFEFTLEDDMKITCTQSNGWSCQL